MEEMVKLKECMLAIVQWWRRIIERINRNNNNGTINNYDDGALESLPMGGLP